MKKYVVLEKEIGETPLECTEAWRAAQPPAYRDTPLAYAGRLDPMASGKLLVLIGEECKQQEKYHGLDKEYEFSVLLGVHSDSGDVLGLVEAEPVNTFSPEEIKKVCRGLTGSIELPYPKFSSKTVRGKPLHTWTLENRLHEIEIPTKTSTIHHLCLVRLDNKSSDEVFRYATKKIETIPPVTDSRKALGNDFRRPEVRASWKAFHEARTNDNYQIVTFRCIASSGTYMRTLAEVIARELGTIGLAYSIHRTEIGHYQKMPFWKGFWKQKF